jgi:hypothetical protein
MIWDLMEYAFNICSVVVSKGILSIGISNNKEVS